VCVTDDFSDSKDLSVDGLGRRPSSQLEVNGQGSRERQQSYVLFEGKEGDGEKFLHVQREFCLWVSFSLGEFKIRGLSGLGEFKSRGLSGLEEFKIRGSSGLGEFKSRGSLAWGNLKAVKSRGSSCP